MTGSVGRCPDENVLVQLAHGGIESPSLRASLQAHLDGCAGCRQLVAAVAGGSAPLAPEAGFTALAPGTTLGRYKVERLIGAGGMGVLYVAHDIRLDRRVALKLMHPSQDDAAGKARLWREAQAMAKLSHPNVVNVFDLGEYEGQLFVAMELVEGGTLADHLRAERTWKESLEILTAAGEGLAAAHRAGVVHRDFKPDNVMLGADGRPRVADFGLARPGAPRPEQPQGLATGPVDLTRTGMMLGTPAYMSPEQLLRQPADARSDQYSFCVTLYEALYGRRPFEGGSFDEVRAKVVKGVLARPPTPAVPDHVWDAVAKGLSVDPAHRFASMEALLTALRTPRSRFSARRVRVAAAGLVALALLGGVTGALVAQQPWPGPRPHERYVPVLLTVSSNPKTHVTVLKPSGERLELGEVPIDRARGAHVGDTVLMWSDALGIRYEERIVFGQPDENHVLFKDFATGKLKVVVSSAPARGLSVWRGDQLLSSNPEATLELYEGTQRLELRGETLKAPVPFEVQIKPKEITTAQVDIASAYRSAAADSPVETLVEVGRDISLRVPNVQRIGVADPSLLDVQTTEDWGLRLAGKKPGTTALRVWTSGSAMREYTVRVLPRAAQPLNLVVGQAESLVVENLARLAVGDSAVADVKTLGGNRVEVTARGPGRTTLLAWTSSGERQTFEVSVNAVEQRASRRYALELRDGELVVFPRARYPRRDEGDAKVAALRQLGDRLALGGVGLGETTVSLWDEAGARTDYQVRVVARPSPSALPERLWLPPGAEAAFSVPSPAGVSSDDPAVAEVERLSEGQVLVRARREGRATVRMPGPRGASEMTVNVGNWPAAH
jgi:eukaryotic-like serine/threonine-protein kinase